MHHLKSSFQQAFSFSGADRGIEKGVGDIALGESLNGSASSVERTDKNRKDALSILRKCLLYGLLLITFGILLKILLVDMGMYDRLMSVGRWIKWIHGKGGVFLLINLSAIAAIISVPPLAIDVVMNIVAGAVYGTILGTCVYVLGTSIGCCVAFQVFKLSCHNSSCFSGSPGSWIEPYTKRAKALSSAMKDDCTGLQITLLLRVSPITPLSICTALLALTELRFAPYALGTVIGLIPASLPYCYLGYVGKDVADKGIPTSVADVIGYFLGAFATILVSYKVYQVSERVLKSVTPGKLEVDEKDAESSNDPEQSTELIRRIASK
ncbi:hypothetical protein AAMO2058_000105800 [Amorphochlora amoebiformis]|mmetsp:Transcript_17921/g.28550  ORF Transcript_17921/g.28550 Transcript_17921/m.28550 type:complete len:324 (-) Transcript_17921:123-1094(-)